MRRYNVIVREESEGAIVTRALFWQMEHVLAFGEACTADDEDAMSRLAEAINLLAELIEINRADEGRIMAEWRQLLAWVPMAEEEVVCAEIAEAASH